MASETITSIQQPWAPQAPFLTSGFQRADQLYGQGPLQPYGGQWVSPFTSDTYTGMNALRSAAGDPTYQNQALGSWGGMLGASGSGLPAFVNPTFQNLAQGGAGAGVPMQGTFNYLANPNNWNADPSAQSALAGFQRQGLPSPITNALGGLQNYFYGGDPSAMNALRNFQGNLPSDSESALRGLTGFNSRIDPYAGQGLRNLSQAQYGPTADVQNALAGFANNTQNPITWESQAFRNLGNAQGNNIPGWAEGGLRQAASGSNPLLGQMYDSAARSLVDNYAQAVAPGVNAAFESAGRYGSGLHQNAQQMAQRELARGLGDLGTNLYGQAYNQDADRQLGASGTAANLYSQNALANQRNRLDAANASAQWASTNFQDQQNRGLNAIGQLGSLQGQGQSLGAQTNLGASQALGGLGLDMNSLNAQTRLNAATQLGGLAQGQYGQQLQAAGTLGDLGQSAAGLTAGTRLGAAGQYGDLFNQNLSNRIGAAGQMGSLYGDAMTQRANALLGSASQYGDLFNNAANLNATTQLNAAQQAGALGNQAYGQNLTAQANALNMAPQMTQLPFQNANALMSLGSYQQAQNQAVADAQRQQWNYRQEAPWDLLNRYNAAVGGSYGGTTTTQQPIYGGQNNWLGYGLMGAGLLDNWRGG